MLRPVSPLMAAGMLLIAMRDPRLFHFFMQAAVIVDEQIVFAAVEQDRGQVLAVRLERIKKVFVGGIILRVIF